MFNIAPAIADSLALHTVAIALFGVSLKRGGLRRGLAASAVAAIVAWSLAAQTFLVLAVPIALTVALGLIVAMPREARWKRVGLALAPTAIVLAVGGAAYALGIMTNTAAMMFPAEMNHAVPRTAYMISILFQHEAHGWMGPALAGAAAFGLVTGLARRDGRRTFVIVAFALTPHLMAVVAFLATSGTWVYPVPLYFELGQWPLYALLGVAGLAWLMRLLAAGVVWAVARIAAFCRGPEPLRKARVDAVPMRLAGATPGLPALRNGRWHLWVAAGGLVAVAVAVHVQPQVPRNDNFGHPPVANRMTDIMARDIGLTKAGTFRGYEATFAGYGGPDGLPADHITQVVHDDKVVKAMGNTMRDVYLWYFDIPTIDEYNPLTSPAFYAVVSRLLSRPRDNQTRNDLMLSRPNLGLLASLGVRYVVADEMLPAPAVQVSAVAIDGVRPLQLYDLPRPNVGDYSPAMPIVVSSATTALAEMGRKDFDFGRQVVLFSDVGGPLVAASRARVDVVVDGYMVEAASAGRSLLLLPIQYSHCIHVDTLRGAPPRLVRANLAQAGLVFEGETAVRLSPRPGIVDNPWCRLDDAREMRALGLANIGTGGTEF
jgi:hypothetical protein